MDKMLVLLIGALTVLTVVAVLRMERKHFPPREKPFSSGFTRPVLAMELVETRDQVKEIVGELGDSNRDIMRDKVQTDFFFIPCYSLLLAALGWLLGRSSYSFARWMGAAIVVCALSAAVFDVMENLRILTVLDARIADTAQTMLNSLRRASLLKWGLIFIGLGLLSPIVFLRRELFSLPVGPPAVVVVLGAIVALAYLLAAIVGLIGLKENPLIETAFNFMFLSLSLTVLFLFISFFSNRRPPGKQLSQARTAVSTQHER